MFKNLVIVMLLGVVSVGGALMVQAQIIEDEISVEIAVWEHKETGQLYASTRPEGGSWQTQRRDDPLNMRFTETASYWRSNIVTITAPYEFDYGEYLNRWRIGNPPWSFRTECTRPVGRVGTGGGYNTAEEARTAGYAWGAANCINTTSGDEPLEPNWVEVTPASR